MSLSARFKPPTTGQPYHILSIEAEPKNGKTHLAATAPGIVAFQSTDFGTDGVLQRWEDYEERFLVAEYKLNVDVTADTLMQTMARLKKDAEELKAEAYREAEAQAARVQREVWRPFVEDYNALLEEPTVRTIVWDTASEVNEILRLAHFGKLEKNPKIAYGPINQEFKALVRGAQEKRKNLVLVHHMTDEYVGDVASGKRKLKGNSGLESLVHSYVRVEKKVAKGEAQFLTTVRDARLAPSATGTVLENADWAALMVVLMPEVDPEVWL